MNQQQKPRTAWNKIQQQQQQPSGGKNRAGKHKKTNPTPSELKFKEAQTKLQAAVEKHLKDYESSSSEDELESDNLIDGIIRNYTQTGGVDANLERTKAFLQDTLISGAAVCLICISRIKRDNAIWNCTECYCFFHLDCIQKWSKDSMFQQKQIIDNSVSIKEKTLTWGCPKCRHDYKLVDIPQKYYCFCRKTINPKYQPLLVPHSCGEICRKDLKPKCGHQCLLLCHPGPCPPCPVTVNFSCYCGKQSPKIQRCSNKEWSCGSRCGNLLTCGKHTCSEPCHAGDCPPCSKKSLQKCLCKNQQKLRDCSSPIWQCDKICNKPLDCGNHNCSIVCHSDDCDPCPLTLPRTCPCGKTKYQLPCTKDTPTCPDTCGKLLDCGQHTCNQRCHKDACGVCLEIVEKRCRCGQHSKQVNCYKSYLCETKCKQIRDCNRHPCNRKCCDGNCPPCEKPCGRTLNCGNHKCNSVCHRGLCYPCNQTETVTCRCGATKLTVSCGRKNRTKPPKCSKLCLIPPDCHHEKREAHKCHFGDCPPCRQICNKSRSTCSHPCTATCHSVVFVKIEGQKASMPWEQTGPQIERKSLPCPDCKVPLPVTCLGGHETSNWPCYMAKPSSCQRPCGRLLDCGNHICTLPCHLVEGAPDETRAGKNCEICEGGCTKERPEGCPHDCLKPCHPGPCPPCKQMIRIRCHCGLNQPYIPCYQWLDLEKREEIQSCGSQCPKNFDCGHRCRANCHSGPCPNSELCKKKVKISCKCKRIKREFPCDIVRNGNNITVDCDDICKQKLEEQRKELEAINEQKRREEEIKNQKELEKYQKIFEGKKKNRERRVYKEEQQESLLKKYKIALITTTGALLSILIVYICS